ncbi:MAG: hypothetical protein DI598_11000, partial [Pseudopedobacter saltans]
MNKIVRFFLLFLFLGMVTNAYTQEYYFRHYQVENGLSNNTVFSCVQDRQGFMWMGTKGGLCRFNGYSFDIFGRDNDSSGLKDGYIRNLYISKAGDLYVG